MEDDWRIIPGFENYIISKEGVVFSLSSNRIKKIQYNSRSYPYVKLSNKNGSQNISIHRLLAILYVDNPYNKPEVNHKDGNKANFSLSNLEWVTKSENSIHAFSTGLSKVENKEDINVYNWKTGQFVGSFKTEEAAAKTLTITSRGNINSCLNNKRDFEKNFIFIYASETNKNVIDKKINKARLNNQANCDRKIKVFTLDNKFIKEYSSLSECAKELNLSVGNTSMCLKGARKTHKGFKFKWSEYE
jgi:hypothetical protein